MDSGTYRANEIIREKTSETPGIYLSRGTLTIDGRSLPENPVEFYSPVMDMFENHAPVLGLKEVNIRLEYLDCASGMCLLGILNALAENACIYESTPVINWHYKAGNGDMLEGGKEYEDVTGLPFRFIKDGI